MAPRLQILLLENIHPFAHEILSAEGFEIDVVKGALAPRELLEKIRDVDVLGIRSKTQVRADLFEAAPRLLTVGCFCIGTNQVDLAAANHHGVPVFNAPFSNTRSVAEIIVAEIIALSRQLGDRSREVHNGTWRKIAASCYEVRGKTIGIVGYGHIGRQLGVLAEAFGMRVLFFDVAAQLPMVNNVAVATLQELLGASDFVSLHVPETAADTKMIGAAELAALRKGSYLLNASRGSVVEIPALAAALKSGHLAGAAVDVYPEEPEGNVDDFKSELQGLANVILTPHIGGSTTEAQAAIGREVATALSKFIRSGATTGAVNFPVVEVPAVRGTHRILNVHRNVPGVLRDINKIVSDRGANIQGQVLSTDANIGYLIMDMEIDGPLSGEVGNAIGALKTNIRTRVLS